MNFWYNIKRFSLRTNFKKIQKYVLFKIKIEDRIKYHAFIPKEILFDILQLWNFFESFYDEIDGPDFSKEELYAALSYNKDN